MTEGTLESPYRLIQLDRVGSTNDEARRLVLDGAAHDLLVVSATEQTMGRGRRGRVWSSPPGNLHCSVILATGAQASHAFQTGFVAAVALCEALSVLVPTASFQCKWPNDVLADGRKVAGLLLEPAADGWLILGLGVDVASAPPPAEALFPPICLAELGYGGDAAAVLGAFARAFSQWLTRWREAGFEPIRQAWLERAVGLSQPIEVRLDRETLFGRFTGLDADGALLLDRGPSGHSRIMAGDVFLGQRD